jgi:hypothetical protein
VDLCPTPAASQPLLRATPDSIREWLLPRTGGGGADGVQMRDKARERSEEEREKCAGP